MVQPAHPTTTIKAFVALLPLALAACAMPSYPDDADFAHYERTYRTRAADQFASLERQRAAGTLSSSVYIAEIQQLEAKITSDAHDALYRHHQLAGERSAAPDAGVSTSIRGASRGGG